MDYVLFTCVALGIGLYAGYLYGKKKSGKKGD